MNGKKFNVTTAVEGTELTVYLQGELDLAAASEFRSYMEPLTSDGDISLTLDLSKLSYIDSTGIGILISILKARKEMNAPFQIVQIPAQVQKLFDMIGISKFFND
ncbi:STAS domain-containing protein [Paenibacillus sp. 1001270B_150601_E10]|uniref:STAS domain-containing protein n=1 Tax=Paenibacillus sp. 1001270B_150601_E10 TaxID=2787079 RepID=UPI00189C89FA|nr:STAS domain-containing protein [Paenibacillus sp. 1001270B_150601_E10]